MSQRFTAGVAYMSFGLIFVILTLVVIRWMIDFVTWTSLDSGWAQAIGTVMAIVGTWYFTKVQLSHAEEIRRKSKAEADAVLAHIAFDLSYATHRTLNNIRSKWHDQHSQARHAKIGPERLEDLAASLRNYAQKDIQPEIYFENLILQREIAYTLTALSQHNAQSFVDSERVMKANGRLLTVFQCRNRVEALLTAARLSAGLPANVLLNRDVSPDDIS